MMNQKKAGILLIAGAFLLTITGSLTGIWIYKSYFETPQYVSFSQPELKPTFSKYTEADEVTQPSNGPNFVAAARAARPAVVYIKSRYAIKRNNNRSDFFSNPFQDFFEDNYDESPRGMASGSGVLISPDGYIATNFHVIEDADELEVSLFDNRSFKAEIIGADPNTDLALIKIDAKGLDHLTFGNSDKVEVGAWVLAVGNPMDLTSTVTAGIVSAKGRNINLLEGERGTDRGLTIESFIQTDAAVNRGNSGGALVNIKGELIGINTAIASRTGSYAGYSFAIPATLVKKVMQDLLEFREVKRGFLGIRIQPITAPLAEEYELETLQGAFITSVNRNSGAYEAGLQAGDVIIEINGLPVNNTSELQEIVSRYRPGDLVEVNFFRDHAPRQLQVQLKDQLGEASLASRAERKETSIKGSDFRTLTEEELEELDISFGIRVEEASSALERGGVPEDFVITEVDGEKIRSLSQFERAVEDAGDYVTIKGLFDKGRIASYSFSW